MMIRKLSNHTEEEVIDIIMKVVKKLSSKYVFGYYEQEDIEQEAFMIAVKCLEKYDEERPLENFLTVSLNNRLKNFKRDNYFRQDTGVGESFQSAKRKLMDAASFFNIIDDCDEKKFDCFDDYNLMEDLYLQETLNKIDLELPRELRADYLRLRAGSPMSNKNKEKVYEAIKDILDGEEG